MTKKTQGQDEPILSIEPIATLQSSKALKLILPRGRGVRGKTTLTRWMSETAQLGGRAHVIADADRTNPSLSRFYSGVISPESADEVDVINFFAHIIEHQVERRLNAVIDLGGGDQIAMKVAREMDLAPWLKSLGIDLVVIHLLGPSRDDLSYLRSVEEDGSLAPPATVIVFNEVAVPSDQSPHAAFTATVREHPILAATLARGAKLVVMPRLATAGDIEASGMSFVQAAQNKAPAGQLPLGLWRAQQTSLWLRRMTDAFAPVQEWLL